MTLLSKTIRRELPVEFDRSAWIAELHPWGIQVRRKRTRKTFPITWETIINRAVHIAVEQERAERKAKRRGARR